MSEKDELGLPKHEVLFEFHGAETRLQLLKMFNGTYVIKEMLNGIEVWFVELNWRSGPRMLHWLNKIKSNN